MNENNNRLWRWIWWYQNEKLNEKDWTWILIVGLGYNTPITLMQIDVTVAPFEEVDIEVLDFCQGCWLLIPQSCLKCNRAMFSQKNGTLPLSIKDIWSWWTNDKDNRIVQEQLLIVVRLTLLILTNTLSRYCARASLIRWQLY